MQSVSRHCLISRQYFHCLGHKNYGLGLNGHCLGLGLALTELGLKNITAEDIWGLMGTTHCHFKLVHMQQFSLVSSLPTPVPEENLWRLVEWGFYTADVLPDTKQ